MRTSQRKGGAVSPRGTRPSFSFFSRDDEFKETDQTQSDFASAQQDLARAKRDLETVRGEFTSVQTLFNDREGRIADILASLDPNSSATPEHAQLLRRVAELTLDIEDTESRLCDARKYSDANAIARLEKEKKTYFSCIQNLDEEIGETEKRIRTRQLELFKILTSDAWHEVTATAAEHQITMRVKESLEQAAKSAAAEASLRDLKSRDEQCEVSPELQALLKARAQLSQQCQVAQQQRIRAQIRRRVTIACLLEDLQRLDAALNALGVDGIDVEKHRRRCLPEGPLSPLKRPKSSNASVRGSKSDYLTGVSAGRSKSDIKRPIRGGRGCLSPLGGR